MSSWPQAFFYPLAPTPTPFSAPGNGSVSGALFYGLLLLGAGLFLAAFIYGRRKGL